MNLRWNENKKRQLEKFISKHSGKFVKSGVSCTYSQISKNIGLKFYTDKKTRDYCVKLQTIAAAKNLAPRVGDSFVHRQRYINTDDCKTIDQTLYGYITEHVKVRKFAWEYNIELQDLHEKLDNLGIRHGDLHDENVGKKNGKYVCIDFDPASCRHSKKIKI